MARARKVDEAQAVAASRELFWQHGFHDLGTRQIETETGLTRFTLQTSYGGKMALFLRSLDSYLDQFEAEMIPAMANGTLDGLAQWFETISMPDVGPPSKIYGCLMINSMIEFAGRNEDVNQRTERLCSLLREGFCAALAQIDEQGGLPKGFDITPQAEVLLSASIGLNVVIRSHRDCAAGASVANGIAAMVRGWGVKNPAS